VTDSSAELFQIIEKSMYTFDMVVCSCGDERGCWLFSYVLRFDDQLVQLSEVAWVPSNLGRSIMSVENVQITRV
jgi:hypothetical protein